MDLAIDLAETRGRSEFRESQPRGEGGRRATKHLARETASLASS